MAQRVGATEAERFQIIARIRSGKTFEEAAAPFRSLVEADWFARNKDELVAAAKDPKVVPTTTPALVETPRAMLEEQKKATPLPAPAKTK